MLAVLDEGQGRDRLKDHTRGAPGSFLRRRKQRGRDSAPVGLDWTGAVPAAPALQIGVAGT